MMPNGEDDRFRNARATAPDATRLHPAAAHAIATGLARARRGGDALWVTTMSACTAGATADSTNLHGRFSQGDVNMRSSGGAPWRVTPHAVYIGLELPSPARYVPCTAGQVINRYVRPLLRALTSLASTPGSKAGYFGRDWVSLRGAPVAAVGFAHHAESNAAYFEALIGVDAPVLDDAHPSLRGVAPTSLVALRGLDRDDAHLAAMALEVRERAARTYLEAFPTLREVDATKGLALPATTHMHSTSNIEGAVLWRGACPMGQLWVAERQGQPTLGGDFMASDDAVTRLLATAARTWAGARDELRAALEAEVVTLAGMGAVTFGLPGLATLAEALIAAHALRIT